MNATDELTKQREGDYESMVDNFLLDMWDAIIDLENANATPPKQTKDGQLLLFGRRCNMEEKLMILLKIIGCIMVFNVALFGLLYLTPLIAGMIRGWTKAKL